VIGLREHLAFCEIVALVFASRVCTSPCACSKHGSPQLPVLHMCTRLISALAAQPPFYIKRDAPCFNAGLQSSLHLRIRWREARSTVTPIQSTHPSKWLSKQRSRHARRLRALSTGSTSQQQVIVTVPQTADERLVLLERLQRVRFINLISPSLILM
jgi:hypothetical protein